MDKFLIAPSLLAADFARLGQEAEAVLAAGADILHFDVMDNHYVPNLTVGPLVCAALRNYGIKAPIDVHLMVRPVDRLIVDFAAAGASNITIHPEATDHLDRSLSLIKDQGCKVGLALNPATSLSCLDYVLAKIDFVLVMTVNPGFGGQKFISDGINKITALKEKIYHSGFDVAIAVDGGINANNIADVANAGASMFIAGSAIFSQPNYGQVIHEMRNNLSKVKK